MPDVYEPTGDEVFSPEMWEEHIDSTQTGQQTISIGAAEATLNGFIPWQTRRSFERYVIGYSWCDMESPWRLHRSQPIRHPYRSKLRAVAVTTSGFGLESNPDNAEGQPRDPGFDPAIDWPVARYELALSTITYRSSRANFLPDSDIASAEDEWKRNVWFDSQGRLEVLSAEGGQFLKIIEGPADLIFAGDGLGPNGKEVTAPYLARMPKLRIVMTWLSVPHDYLSNDPDILYPIRFINCLGKVNSIAFLGINKQCALMEPPEFTASPYPYETQIDYGILRAYDCKVAFDVFDPIPGDTSAGHPIGRGHNLLPWRVDGKWYTATRNGQPNGPLLLETANFWQIFHHWNDPFDRTP